MKTIEITSGSALAERPASVTSDRYEFFSTKKLVDHITSNSDWAPVNYSERKTRIAERQGFQKHAVIFRRVQDMQDRGTFNHMGNPLKADEIPQIMLINSHDGTSALEMKMGFFRLVCSNGLIVPSSMIGDFKIRHFRQDFEEVLGLTKKLTSEIEVVADLIPEYKSIQLSVDDQMAFAEAAVAIRDRLYNSKTLAESLLNVRRQDDVHRDLYTTFNVIQENLIRGGASQLSTRKDGSEYVRRTRSVSSIDASVKINTQLWEVMENFRVQREFVSNN